VCIVLATSSATGTSSQLSHPRPIGAGPWQGGRGVPALAIRLSDTVVVALIGAFGVAFAALITGLAMVIAAWLQSRGRGPS